MLMQLLRQYGMMNQGGGMPQMGGAPQGQMPPMQGQMSPAQGQMPPAQGQLPPMDQGAQPQQGGHHHGGLSPWMALSPLGGMFASSPKTALSLMSPAFGIANLLGAFK
jgi:hypothetical protein